jgi:hypothetical protein
VFSTFQVFVNACPGFMTVPEGMVTSRTKARLLHPKASEAALTVAVDNVPVGVTVTVPGVGE